MNWFLKAAAFKVLSALPGGPAIYGFCREHLTGSLVPTPERIRQKIDVGLQYWDWLAANHFNGSPQLETHLDFGAGWHPTIPLLFYSLGIERQILGDIAPFVNRETIEMTVKIFCEIASAPKYKDRLKLERLPQADGELGLSAPERLQRLGMDYQAPFAPVASKFTGTVSFATCTQVLYFIPKPDLRASFRQLHELLKPGGKFLATIHLNDVNATWHHGVSQYNHLRYSPEVWDNWINSKLMSYNRLKAADYRQLLEESGFTICHFDVTSPTAADLEELSRIPIHPCFKRYSREELGGKHLYFVAEKV